VAQKSWTTARQLVGYMRYDTPAELALPNRIWAGRDRAPRFGRRPGGGVRDQLK
jgi:hypothetical protein